jgi:hypothetical protein
MSKPVILRPRRLVAEEFRVWMWSFIEEAAATRRATIVVDDGIVTLTFPDGSTVDFTCPLSFPPKEEVE